MIAYGRITYGHKIMGRVVLASPVDACSELLNQHISQTEEHPVIILTEEGGCPFATKTFNAQNAGAVGVLIIDKNSKTEDSFVKFNKTSEISQIKIPSILISKLSSKELLEAVYKEESSPTHDEKNQVIISLDFPITKKIKTYVYVKVDLSDYESFTKVFIKVIDYLHKLKGRVDFIPVYNLHPEKVVPSATIKKLAGSCVGLPGMKTMVCSEESYSNHLLKYIIRTSRV